jgi:hypothetical protein
MEIASSKKAKCPRCGLVYACKGEPTKNPGGMGAKDGWTCTFCVDDPPLEEKQQALGPDAPAWANCWHPVYLEPYDGPKEADFEQFSL